MLVRDLMKQRFERLIVIQRNGKDKNNHVLWLCRCDCGREKIIKGTHLITGHTQSCGCLKKEGNNSKHNHTKNGKQSKIYQIWACMTQRCTNPHTTNYHNYGGRGIEVCERWTEFENFLIDMGEIPKGCQIDRINNNGNYCKENCHWVTPKQNGRNRRTNRLITFRGKTQCVTAWAEEIGISSKMIYKRLNRNWFVERALTAPTKQRKVL